MQRCIQLALSGAGMVAPNPMVGAVLVYNDRIIGEGYHRQYGAAHAEVNCINSVAAADRALIAAATLYVSLEPCAHFGKTPPCSDLIITNGIKTVVIGCQDPFTAVNGKGIEKLRNAGVDTIVGVLENACLQLNKAFFTFHTLHRPYIIIKWAQTADAKVAAADTQQRLIISNDITNRLVHRWRSETAAILVGTNTALMDDPVLNNRLWTGQPPLRMVLDLSLRLPNSLKLFNNKYKTIVFNDIKQETDGLTTYVQLNRNTPVIPQILDACYTLNIQSILVEGGPTLIQAFFDAGQWDEARVITNATLLVNNGLAAPTINNHYKNKTEQYQSDKIDYYTNKPINQ